MLHTPRDFLPFHLFLGQVDDRLVGSGLVQQFHRGFDGKAEFLVAKVALLAETDQQDAIRERAADVMQQQRAAELPFHVAAADDLADITVRSAIDQLRRQRRLSIVKNTDNDTGAPLFLGATAFYGKFHRSPPHFRCWLSLP